ncbi:MAG: DUF4388 domain-containing protein [Acidobacteriota bacterium]
MSLAGTLDELALPDILQIISLAEKTGRLSLTTRDAEGLIVFRRGRIIYASSNAAREAFGCILVGMKLIDEATLRKALIRQHRSHEERRLGRILVEVGALSEEDLERVVQRQVEKVVGELFTWSDGFFKFEPLEIPDCGEVEVDAKEFLADGGLNAHKVALDLTRLSDEQRHGQRKGADAMGHTVELRLASAGRERATLQEIIGSPQPPSLTAEFTQEVLRLAASFFGRGVLMLVERQGITGIGQFGPSSPDSGASERARDLWLPIDEPSIVGEVVASRTAYRGPLLRLHLNELIVALLGKEWPKEVGVVPLTWEGQVIAVLYGDDHGLGAGLPSLMSLERRLATLTAGLAGGGQAPPERPAAASDDGSLT